MFFQTDGEIRIWVQVLSWEVMSGNIVGSIEGLREGANESELLSK